jgi:predicted dehydrogenase
MKVLVVGLGTQGKKRINYLGDRFLASVDPTAEGATYQDITEVNVDSFNAVFLCVPDNQKLQLIDFCIKHKKHILVEKPLFSKDLSELTEIQNKANLAGIFVYTAYNHRFEPHFENLKAIIDSKELGKIYSVRMFYGNGTSKLVQSSEWRDQGMGVISDLSPHLLDTLAFWFGTEKLDELFIRHQNFETKAPDHAVILANYSKIELELVVSLCMWRNTFQCDIIGEMGSAHISSLCKWGPSVLTLRKRILPSGNPVEILNELVLQDPTWELEHDYFFRQIENKSQTNLSRDIWIAENLAEMEKQ